MRVGALAVGRSGDKGATLDLTLVARDEASYERLARWMTAEAARRALDGICPGTVTRYEVPGLLALKFVVAGALPGGVYATLRAGMHWQKAAIWALLDAEIG
jgi:hypothetical protein